jgi:hypothetical protein
MGRLDGANHNGLIDMADVMYEAHRDGWGNGCELGWLMGQKHYIAGLGCWMAAARATDATVSSAAVATTAATVTCLVVSSGFRVTVAALVNAAATTTTACC